MLNNLKHVVEYQSENKPLSLDRTIKKERWHLTEPIM